MKGKWNMIFILGIFSVLLLSSGCSSKPSVELVSATVDIKNDKGRLGGIGITSGERKGEYITPIALSYDFVLKNTNNKTLGGVEKLNKQTFEYEDGIKIKLEPDEKLQTTIQEMIGANIFEEKERKKAKLGKGETGVPILESDQEGEYTLDLILGAKEENPEIPLAPSSKQLEKLKEYAMYATLIVSVDDEEIARFDLNNID